MSAAWDGHVAAGLAKVESEPSKFTAIFLMGADGTPWNTAPYCAAGATAEQLKHLIACVADNSKAQAQGPKLGDVKYMFTRGENGEHMQCKKGTKGMIVIKSTQCFIVAVTDEAVDGKIDFRNANVKAEGLHEYLTAIGY